MRQNLYSKYNLNKYFFAESLHFSSGWIFVKSILEINEPNDGKIIFVPVC